MYSEIQELLRLSKMGDVNAKEVLLQKLNPLIIYSIRRYYNKIEQYDDLIQDGNEIILLAIREYNPNKGARFLGYVKTMLKYYYLRKHREKGCVSLNKPVNGGELMDVLEGNEGDPAGTIVKIEEIHQLSDALAILSEKQRQVIVDYYFNKLSISQIAEKLGLSYRAVVNRKVAAINKLKKTMVK